MASVQLPSLRKLESSYSIRIENCSFSISHSFVKILNKSSQSVIFEIVPYREFKYYDLTKNYPTKIGKLEFTSFKSGDLNLQQGDSVADTYTYNSDSFFDEVRIKKG